MIPTRPGLGVTGPADKCSSHLEAVMHYDDLCSVAVTTVSILRKTTPFLAAARSCKAFAVIQSFGEIARKMISQDWFTR
jgi:hypothetical protein